MSLKVKFFKYAAALALVGLGSTGHAQEKWGNGSGVWDALQQQDSGAGGSDDKQTECQAQSAIFKMKSSMTGKCEGLPQGSDASKLACPDADGVGQSPQPTTGGKVEYGQSEPRAKLGGDEVDPAPAGHTDCSGLVSSLCSSMGWNLQPGKEINAPTTTAEMKKLFDGGNSCFKKVSGEPRPGDIFVWNNGTKGHTGMFVTKDKTFESTAGGPQYKDHGGSGGGVKSDEQGAMQKRGGEGYYRFQKNKSGCKRKAKKIKKEQAIDHCPGVQDANK